MLLQPYLLPILAPQALAIPRRIVRTETDKQFVLVEADSLEMDLIVNVSGLV